MTSSKKHVNFDNGTYCSLTEKWLFVFMIQNMKLINIRSLMRSNISLLPRIFSELHSNEMSSLKSWMLFFCPQRPNALSHRKFFDWNGNPNFLSCPFLFKRITQRQFHEISHTKVCFYKFTPNKGGWHKKYVWYYAQQVE